MLEYAVMMFPAHGEIHVYISYQQSLAKYIHSARQIYDPSFSVKMTRIVCKVQSRDLG